jgi:hypothetical protein
VAEVKEKGVALLDRRLRRIERWLRRLMSACGCEEWSSALMEAECMEAETKGLRDDLWRTVENETCRAARRSLASVLIAGVKVSFIAMFIVLSSVFPLSVDQDRPPSTFSMESEGLFANNREGEILNSLKRTLSGRNRERSVLYADSPSVGGGEQATASVAKSGGRVEPVAETQRTASKTTPVVESDLSQAAAEAAPAEKTPVRHEPSVDDVISLIQVGQRALRLSERAVSMYP